MVLIANYLALESAEIKCEINFIDYEMVVIAPSNLITSFNFMKVFEELSIRFRG